MNTFVSKLVVSTKTNSKCELFLGIKSVSNLTFNGHVSDICEKASRKENALVRSVLITKINKILLINNFLPLYFFIAL